MKINEQRKKRESITVEASVHKRPDRELLLAARSYHDRERRAVHDDIQACTHKP